MRPNTMAAAASAPSGMATNSAAASVAGRVK